MSLSSPRRFLFPAVLLLLAAGPGYGYRLVKELEGFRFGGIDRPSVYRTLAQLERDGLVVSWSDDAKSAQARRLYRLTPAGQQALRVWMGVIKEERDRLDAVLRRYAGSGGVDAALAGVEGGWGAVHGPPLSSVSPTTEQAGRPLRVLPRQEVREPPQRSAEAVPRPVRRRPGSFGRARRGPFDGGSADVRRDRTVRHDRDAGAPRRHRRRRSDGGIGADPGRRAPFGQRHLRRRAGAAHRGPTIPDRRADPARLLPGGGTDRYRVVSDVTIHGVTRRLEGNGLVVTQPGSGLLSVTGEQVVDIRDFDITSPTVLMLRIYPDVVVKLYLEAEEVALDHPPRQSVARDVVGGVPDRLRARRPHREGGLRRHRRQARALRDSDEVRELLAVVRNHAGQALRGLADLVERGEAASGGPPPARP